MWVVMPRVSVAEYSRMGMLTRPKAIEPFQIDFIANAYNSPSADIRPPRLADYGSPPRELFLEVSSTISCVLFTGILLYADMAQSALVTKWKFVVEFEDHETKLISGTIGQADTREECEGLIEHDIQYHRSLERTVINTEAVELCAQCGGDGKIPIGNGREVICKACGGHFGPISKSTSFCVTSTVQGRLLGSFPGLGRSAVVHLRPVEPELFR
jgi:hypothetical protein